MSGCGFLPAIFSTFLAFNTVSLSSSVFQFVFEYGLAWMLSLAVGSRRRTITATVAAYQIEDLVPYYTLDALIQLTEDSLLNYLHLW